MQDSVDMVLPPAGLGPITSATKPDRLLIPPSTIAKGSYPVSSRPLMLSK